MPSVQKTYPILEGTFMPLVNEGMEKLEVFGGFDVYERRQFKVADGDDDTPKKDRYYVVFAGNGQEDASDTLLYGNTTINVMSSGDLAQLMTNLGRDHYDRNWCYWCDLSKGEWSVAGHPEGNSWSILQIESHLESLKGGEPSAVVKGVRRKPILRIDVCNTTAPVLHLQLGLVNNVLERTEEEAQASMETYTEEYLYVENQRNENVISEEQATTIRDNFNEAYKKDVKQLRQEKKNEKDPAGKNKIEAALGELKKFQDQLEGNKKRATQQLKESKAAFKRVAAEPQNNKVHGQPLRKDMEYTLKDQFGLDKGVYFGGDFQGPACRKVMTRRDEIYDALWNLFSSKSDRMIVEQSKVKKVMEAHQRLLGHFDAIFSICRIKRYHITTHDLDRLKEHVKHAAAMWRALGFSVTPKMHFVEDHLVDVVTRFRGVGDLGEDEGERGHQTGHRNEMRTKSMRNHQAKAWSHAQTEAMSRDPGVREYQATVEKDSKRKRRGNQETKGEKNAKAAKLTRECGRDQLLCLPVQVEAFPRLTELRKEALKEHLKSLKKK
jgi:hypothetical protein